MKVNIIIAKKEKDLILIVEIVILCIKRNIKESGEKGKEQMIKFIIGLTIGICIGVRIMCPVQINRGEEDE